jgi:hypothetical protein
MNVYVCAEEAAYKHTYSRCIYTHIYTHPHTHTFCLHVCKYVMFCTVEVNRERIELEQALHTRTCMNTHTNTHTPMRKVQVNGERVELEEVESVLKRCRLVQAAAAYPDPSGTLRAHV